MKKDSAEEKLQVQAQTIRMLDLTLVSGGAKPESFACDNCVDQPPG